MADPITLPPLPHPVVNAMLGDDWEDLFTADQMHAYAAAASAAKDAEIMRLMAKVERLKSVPMKYRRMEFNAQLQKENAALRAEVAGLREDAERYRWLRDKLDVSDQATWNIFMSEGVEQWDAAIDAARKGEA